MKEKAQGIINRGINNFERYYNQDTADYGLHVMIGKILLIIIAKNAQIFIIMKIK